MNKIIIFGISDLALQLYYYIKNYSNDQIIGFTAHQEYATVSFFENLPVFPFEELDQYVNKEEVKVLLCLGYKNMKLRTKLFKEIISNNWQFTNFIHPGARLSNNVQIGVNNIFLDGVIVEPFSTIGDNNIFWSGSIICHDNTIGSHNFIAAKSLSGGFNELKDRIFLGFASTLAEQIIISNDVIIGANSLVLTSINNSGTYVGSPVKRIR